jgi:hypothetical protein
MTGRQVDVEIAFGGITERVPFEHFALVPVDDYPSMVTHEHMVTPAAARYSTSASPDAPRPFRLQRNERGVLV